MYENYLVTILSSNEMNYFFKELHQQTLTEKKERKIVDYLVVEDRYCQQLCNIV